MQMIRCVVWLVLYMYDVGSSIFYYTYVYIAMIVCVDSLLCPMKLLACEGWGCSRYVVLVYEFLMCLHGVNPTFVSSFSSIW